VKYKEESDMSLKENAQFVKFGLIVFTRNVITIYVSQFDRGFFNYIYTLLGK